MKERQLRVILVRASSEKNVPFKWASPRTLRKRREGMRHPVILFRGVIEVVCADRAGTWTTAEKANPSTPIAPGRERLGMTIVAVVAGWIAW
jgi:hypothetical protein